MKSEFNLDRRAANKAALTEEENAELKTLNADTKATRRNSQSEEQKAEANKNPCANRVGLGFGGRGGRSRYSVRFGPS